MYICVSSIICMQEFITILVDIGKGSAWMLRTKMEVSLDGEFNEKSREPGHSDDCASANRRYWRNQLQKLKELQNDALYTKLYYKYTIDAYI